MSIGDRTLRELICDQEVDVKSSRAPSGLPIVRVSAADSSLLSDGSSGEKVTRKLWHLGCEDLIERAGTRNFWLYCWSRIEEITPLIHAVAVSGSKSEWYMPHSHKPHGPGYIEQSLAWEVDIDALSTVTTAIQEQPPQIASLTVWSGGPSRAAIVDMYSSTGMGLGLWSEPDACDLSLEGLWILNDWGSELYGVARRNLFEHWFA